MPTLRVVRERLQRPSAIIYECKWRGSGNSETAADMLWLFKHAAPTDTHPRLGCSLGPSCQLLLPAPEQRHLWRRVVPRGLSRWVWSASPWRESRDWGGCFEPGRFYWHARCLGFGIGFLNPGRASRHPCCPNQGAPQALLLLGSGAQQPALHLRRKCNRWWARSCERQGKTCQGVSSWSDSFSFMEPEPGQSPLWHCASFLVYV